MFMSKGVASAPWTAGMVTESLVHYKRNQSFATMNLMVIQCNESDKMK